MRQLPKGLQQIYERALEKINTSENNLDLIKRVFYWLSLAVRPLSKDELLDLVTVTKDQPRWDRTRIPTDIIQVLRLCRFLIKYDKQDDTIRFVHSTVKDFLMFTTNRFMGEKGQTEQYVCHICLTYLSFEDFQCQLVEYGENGSTVMIPSSVLTPKAWLSQIVSSNSKTAPIWNIVTSVRSTKSSAKDKSITYQVPKAKTQINVSKHHALPYILEHWTKQNT